MSKMYTENGNVCGNTDGKNTAESINNLINKLNEKENDTMMNKTNKENRMETLRNNGIDTSKFFDLSMRIPFGAEVKLIVDGKEMVIPASNGFTPGVSFGGDFARDIDCACVADMKTVDSSSYSPIIPGVTTAHFSDDPIVQNIMKNGYVFNSRVDGRFATAQMFKMLNGISCNIKTGKHETGYDAYLRNYYGYMYQFDMMLDELHRLARMERDGDKDFYRLSQFFTKDVVYQTCKDYIRKLNKYVNSQPTRKCKKKPYVKLNKYGNVYISDLYGKVYVKLDLALSKIMHANNYKELEDDLKFFMKIMCKLPYDTPKCSQWKDAFKGKGSYVTLLNICKFHNVNVVSYETGELLDRDSSVAYVENKLAEYKGNYWKFHELLKATIKANNFDLKKSIEN